MQDYTRTHAVINIRMHVRIKNGSYTYPGSVWLLLLRFVDAPPVAVSNAAEVVCGAAYHSVCHRRRGAGMFAIVYIWQRMFMRCGTTTGGRQRSRESKLILL